MILFLLMNMCAGSYVNLLPIYVFYHILRDMNTDATVTGLIQLKSSNKHVPRSNVR